VDIHQTEEQQVEAIKGFWKENGNSLIAGTVIGFGLFIGYNFYQDNKLQQELTVSENYQKVIELAETDKNAYRTSGDAFIKDNADSSYSALTALALAKDAAGHKDWSQVEKYLNIAVEKSTDAGVKGIAQLRLAQVKIQLAQYDNALTTLALPFPESFKASIEESKGDIYLKQDKVELARNAYQAALAVDGQATNSSLQMKLDNLAENVNLAN